MRNVLNICKQFVYAIFIALLVTVAIIIFVQPLPYLILKVSTLWSSIGFNALA